MKRLVIVVILAILLVGLVLLGLSDTSLSIGHGSVPNHEAATSVGKGSNSWASATLTITMYAVADG